MTDAADRTIICCRSRRPLDAAMWTLLRELANERRRFGYRRLFILLRREGESSGINRIYRLYREEGLTTRKRRARRRAVGSRCPILIEAKMNARWSLDFAHDQFAQGRRLRILNVVDDVTRECLAVISDTSISDERVACELTAIIEQRGKPAVIVSGHGAEFTSNAFLAWLESIESPALHRARQTDAELLYRVIQRPDARRLLNETLFFNLAQARQAMRKTRVKNDPILPPQSKNNTIVLRV